MKIALVYDAVYPYIKGGGEKRFYDIAKKLTERGHEVHIYGMKLWLGNNIIKKEGIYYHGLTKAMPLYTKNGKRSISQAIIFGLACFKLMNEDFDIIDSGNFPYFSLFALKFVSIMKRKPLIVTWHEVWGKDYWINYIGSKGILGYLTELSSSRMPDKIISVSKSTENKLTNHLSVNNNKVTTIPNFIDIKEINKTKTSKEKSDIVFAGRLLEYKNIDKLIQSILLIKAKNKKIKVIIIGDGPEMSRLKELSKELGLNNNIVFKGFLKDEKEVYSLIKSSKVFVLPSSREGFGIAALEANALGIPVITINHRDNAAKYLINEGKNGFISDLNEISLSENIIKAIKLSKKMKSPSIRFARDYDWSNIIPKLEEVYGK